MRRWVRIGALIFVAGCGASAKTGGESNDAWVTKTGTAPTGSASAAPGDATKEAEAQEAEKQRQLQQQLESSKDEAEREQLLRKLEDAKTDPDKSNRAEPDAKPRSDKRACKCEPGDPLCSCVPDDGVKGKKRATVHAAATSSMTGRLSPAQVESAVAQQIDVFAACTRDDVTVSLKALITEKGVVAKVSAGKSQPDKASLRECVAAAFKTIQFPVSSDGKSIPIEFDLVLSPSS